MRRIALEIWLEAAVCCRDVVKKTPVYQMADGMSVWRAHVGSERAHARIKSCIRRALQQVNARLSRLLAAGTHAETVRFDRRHLIFSVPEWKLIVDELHTRCLLVRTESVEVFAEEVEVHRLTNRIRPSLFLLHILSKMIPVDVESYALVVCT